MDQTKLEKIVSRQLAGGELVDTFISNYIRQHADVVEKSGGYSGAARAIYDAMVAKARTDDALAKAVEYVGEEYEMRTHIESWLWDHEPDPDAKKSMLYRRDSIALAAVEKRMEASPGLKSSLGGGWELWDAFPTKEMADDEAGSATAAKGGGPDGRPVDAKVVDGGEAAGRLRFGVYLKEKR